MVDEAAEWHLLRGKAQTGPFPLAKVLETIEQNLLQKTDHVWRHGWPEWRLAGSVPELFGEAASQANAPTSEPVPKVTQPEAIGKPAANYFVRHWRGDLSLPMSFWVNGVVLGIAFQMIGAMVVGVRVALLTTMDLEVGAVSIAIVVLVLGLALAVWQCVGIWRAASRHEERGGHAAWGVVVKLLTVLWIVATAAAIILL